MMRWVALVLLVGCAEENPRLVIERQSATLADAAATGWSPGSALVTAQPGTFTFPQPLSVRFTIVSEEVDATSGLPTPLAITMGAIEPFGSGPMEITTPATCEGMLCTAELNITAAGSSMVHISANGPNGAERECFYYSLVEGAADTMTLRAELETQQQDCKYGE